VLPTDRSSFPWRSAWLLTLGFTLSLVFAVRPVVFGPPLLEIGDPAVNALQIDRAKTGQELYGNYSRFHFHHPGPAFFYIYAAGEWLFYDALRIAPSPNQAHTLAGIALQSTFCAFALALIAQRLRARRALPVLAAVAAAYFGLSGTAFTSLWPPYVLAMPFLCFLAAATSAASGHPRHFLVAIAAGGFLVHGHVAQPLFVGALSALTLGVIGWRVARGGNSGLRHLQLRWRIAAGSVLVVFLLPLLIDFLRYGLTGNTATIVRRFIVNTEDAKSLLQAVLYLLSFATSTHQQEQLLREVGPETGRFFAAHWAWLTGWAVVLAGGLTLFRYLWPKLSGDERRFACTAVVFWMATLALCIGWGLAQAGPMHHYNGAFFTSVFAWPLLLIAAAGVRALPPAVSRFGSAAGVVAAAASLVFQYALGSLNPDVQGLPIRRAVTGALAHTESRRPKILIFDEPQWPVAASVALILQREGFDWYISERWAFMFKHEHDLVRLGPNPAMRADIWHVDATDDGAGFPAQTVTITTELPVVHPGETIIDSATNMHRFALTGLEVTTPLTAWSVLPRALLVFETAPAESDVRIVFDAAASERIPSRPDTQPADVYLNGTFVGRVVARRERAPLAVVVPRAVWNSLPRPTTLELTFPDAVPDRSFSRPRSRDAYAWGLWSIRFEAIP
jgi:hypothetical protein